MCSTVSNFSPGIKYILTPVIIKSTHSRNEIWGSFTYHRRNYNTGHGELTQPDCISCFSVHFADAVDMKSEVNSLVDETSYVSPVWAEVRASLQGPSRAGHRSGPAMWEPPYTPSDPPMLKLNMCWGGPGLFPGPQETFGTLTFLHRWVTTSPSYHTPFSTSSGTFYHKTYDCNMDSRSGGTANLPLHASSSPLWIMSLGQGADEQYRQGHEV